MSIPKHIFTYWQGPMPPIIAFCLNSIKERSGIETTILTQDTYRDYLKGAVHPQHVRLTSIAQKVDCIRLGVLYHHGGMWCDADTVVLRSMAHLFDTDAHAIILRWPHNNRAMNGYFFTEPKSPFIKAALDSVNLLMKKRPQAEYSEWGGCVMGEGAMEAGYVAEPQAVDTLPVETLVPIQFPSHPDIWGKPLRLVGRMKDYTVAVALNYSQMSAVYKAMSVKEIARENSLMGSVLRCYLRCTNECFNHCSRYVRAEYEEADAVLRPYTPEEFKKYGLPPGFGPSHPDYNVPSKKNKFKRMVIELSNAPATVPPDAGITKEQHGKGEETDR